MLNEELIGLISAGRMTEAATRLKNEKSRLSTVSASHPIFDLLKYYRALKDTSSYSYEKSRYGLQDLSSDQLKEKEEEMLVLLDAMLDAKTDPHMQLHKSHSTSWTNDQEARAQIGLSATRTGEAHQYSYDYNENNLYSRLAALGWVSAMALLQKRGVNQSNKQLTAAFLNVCQSNRQSGLDFLLKHHQAPDRSEVDYNARKIMPSIMAWQGVDPVSVNEVFERYGVSRSFDWANKNSTVRTQDRTSIEWLSLERGRWEKIHATLREEFQDLRRGATDWVPALFPALFNEYVRTGDFADLLKEALSGPSFEFSKGRAPYKSNFLLSSLVLQGSVLDFPSKDGSYARTHYFDEPKEPAPSVRQFAQIRRAVKLHRFLVSKAAPEHTSLFPNLIDNETDATRWASKGWGPTQAFVKRHPEFMVPATNGNTALHFADKVETALVWEKLGVPATSNKEGVDPWVLGMQRSPNPAPWAREIAQRLKDGRLGLDAMGEQGKPLLSIATKSPPFARALLKKSRNPLTAHMMSGGIEHAQWGLISEWVKQGWLDHNPPCRALFCTVLVKPPVYSATPTAVSNWTDAVSALASRPNAPWPEQIAKWKEVIKSGFSLPSGQSNENMLHGMKALANWGANGREYWQQEDNDLILNLFQNTPQCWKNICPITPTTNEVVDIVWRLLLDVSVGVASRYEKVAQVINGIGEHIPLHQAGLAAFEKLDQVNEDAPLSFGRLNANFVSFLDAERLRASTQPSVSAETRRSPSGRRL